MRGAIWGLTIERAKKELEKIKNKYETLGIKIIKEKTGKYNQEVIFENGDYWKIFTANDSCRGYKVNISYIDRLLSNETINTIIFPCTIAFPYNAFNYFEV